MNILIVGLGSIATKHLKAIDSLNIDTNICALRSKSGKIENKNIQHIYNLNELLVKPDFVIISNPTAFHANTILDLLKLNCPLFIEKPVLNNCLKADDISRLIKKNKTITYVACNMRFHPSIKFLKSFLETTNPNINEINVYCGSYLPDWRTNIDFRKSYSSNSQMGGGVHLDLIHELDYCNWIFGSPNKIHSLKRSLSTLKINSVDYANYNLLYDKFSLNLVLNYYRKNPKREIEIITENDIIVVDLLKNTVISSDKTLFNNKYFIQDTYNDQMKYFISKILKNEHPMNGFDEGVRILKLALNE